MGEVAILGVGQICEFSGSGQKTVLSRSRLL